MRKEEKKIINKIINIFINQKNQINIIIYLFILILMNIL